jgi:hypothetical protein
LVLIGLVVVVAGAAGAWFVLGRLAKPGPGAGVTKRPPAEREASTPPAADDAPAPEDTQPGPLELTSDDFVVISGPTSPRVAYALRRTDRRLDIVLDVATFAEDGTGASVELGVAAAKKVLLSGGKAKRARVQGGARFSFAVPATALVEAPADWKKLRMALAVRWAGGPAGADRLRERFRHTDLRAPHAELSSDPGDWEMLDPAEYETLVADRKKRIAVELEPPPMKGGVGKVTVVIEDGEGRRVRNLVSGVEMPAGPQQIEWDGLGDDGVLVKAGTYRWRSVHHPGIVPEYLFSFCNGGERSLFAFGSNHMLFTAATANEKYVFFAAPMTEGGHAMIAVELGGPDAGAWRHGYNPIHGSGMNTVAVAADGKFLYAAHDGEAWGQHINRRTKGWKATVHLTLSRFDVESGRHVDYPGGRRFVKVETHA